MGPITAWAASSTAALAIMTFLYLGTRDDLASQREQCNADKLASIAEAERITRQAAEAALADRLAELARQAQAAERALEGAEAARLEAESRPERVRTIIREVADTDACITTAVPAAVIDSLQHD